MVSVLLEMYTALSPLGVSREIQVNTAKKKFCLYTLNFRISKSQRGTSSYSGYLG